VEQLTGGGGRHILFKHREGTRNKAALRPGLDVRGEGGYIVVAPSLHESGNIYQWEASSRPGEVALAEAPDWLLELVRPTNGQVKESAPPVEGEISEGGRNDTLTSLAGTMRRRNFSKAATVQALLEENRTRCNPPLPEGEVRKIADSVARYDPPSGTASGEGEQIFKWPELQPLPEKLPAVEPFTSDLLPEAFRPWVSDVAERMQCPPDFAAVASLIALLRWWGGK